MVIRIYRIMQKYWWTFQILILLKRLGIVDYVSYNVKQKKEQGNGVTESKNYFEKNYSRINEIIRILEDEKSKQIYLNVLRYRMYGKKIEKENYSYHNQYFDREIIKLTANEIFVDGGGILRRYTNRFSKKNETESFTVYNCCNRTRLCPV